MSVLVAGGVVEWSGGNSETPFALHETANGNRWAFYVESTSDGRASIYAKYSTNAGVSWSSAQTVEGTSEYGEAASGQENDLAAYIDEDDYLHLIYRNSTGDLLYKRGTPNAGRTSWTMSIPMTLESGSASVALRYPDIVAFRMPAGGWSVAIVMAYDNSANGWARGVVYWRIPIAANGTIGGAVRDGLAAQGGLQLGGQLASTAPSTWSFPKITFHHAGNGKTVKDGTPHLYVSWTGQQAAAGQGILFRKAVFNAGGNNYAWNAVREVDATRRAFGSVPTWISFDGTRAVIAGMFYGTQYDLMVYDITDASITTRVVQAGVTDNTHYIFSGFSLAETETGDVHFVGRDNSGTTTTRRVIHKVWNRTANTLSPETVLESDAPNNTFMVPKPSFSGNKIEFVFDKTAASGVLDLHYRSMQLNRAPNAPTLTAPNGAEVINTTATVSATGTDPDGDTVVFDYDLTTDNGATWTRIITGGGTTQQYDFTNVPATTAARIRVRTRDPLGKASTWDESNANFIIQHNRAPYAPTLVAPVGNAIVPRTAPVRLEFTPNDPDAGDSKSKHDIEWRPAGSGAAPTLVTATSTASYHEFAEGYFPAGNIEWRARTYDALGVVGPYSDWAYFTAATPPAGPAITAPVNNGAIATSQGMLTWSTPEQEGYRVRKLGDLNGAANPADVLFDTGPQTTVAAASVRTQALTFPVNGRVEHLQVQILDDGLWSTWSSVRVTVDYAAPADAPLTLVPRREIAAIRVLITNPDPVAPEPAVSENWLYRREAGVGAEWTRIAVVAPNTVYEDQTVASNTSYEYYASIRGVNETSTDTETFTASVNFTGIWLLDPRDPLGTAHQFRWDGMGRSTDWAAESFRQDFVGRTYPVVEFGEREDFTIAASVALDDETNDRQALEHLARLKTVLLYRDGRGRKAYVHLPRYPLEDKTYGAMFALSAYQVDYTEGV